ncbi:MAG: TetR/AcrR family transcriptional regulator [Acidimicrobiia bacterium]|nr:TetR/AcrR family transcriptional regulator [Acidimicrobiia bacterium]
MSATAARPRLPASKRRAAILDAAVELFSSKGFRGVTTRALAASVGVTEPVLYQHFASKHALYEAILEMKAMEAPFEVERELERFTEAGDSQAFFTLLATLILNWYCEDPRYARLLMYSALEGHELSDLFYERHVAIFYGWVTRHIESQVRRGKMRRTPPLLAARAFAGMVAHQGLIYAIYHPGDLAASRKQVVKTVVDLYLQGIMK